VSKVVQIKPCTNIPLALRNIADQYEAGDFEGDCTLVIGLDVFHLGTFDDSLAARDAVWNLTYAIHKLMYLPSKVTIEDQE